MTYELNKATIEEAKTWTLANISMLNEGGMWAVPRSLSFYRVWNTKKEYLHIEGGEDCIDEVLNALGYVCVDGVKP
jgi:hypothetical protein